MFPLSLLSGVLDYPVLLFSIFAVIITVVLVLPFIVLMNTDPYCIVKRRKEEEYYLDEYSRHQPFPSIRDVASVNLSVIVPAYNEEIRLKPMLDEAMLFLIERKKSNSKFSFEIIVVNDGSTDRTSTVAGEYTKKYGSDLVRVLNLSYNRGKGGAVRLGMLSARGSVLLFADADGATKFEDISKLESSLQNIVQIDYIEHPEKIHGALAIVCGSRAHLQDEAISRRSYFRTFLMKGFHFLVWLVTVTSIKDTQCGFKMLTREAAAQCFLNIHVERWAFDVELLYVAHRFQIPVDEVAVNWTEIEGSKIIPVFSWLQMAVDLFLIWFRYFIGVWDIVVIKKESSIADGVS